MPDQTEGQPQKNPTVEEEAIVRIERKKALRQLNSAAYVSRPDPDSYKNLDGSIKKNTSFIKKIRNGQTNDQLQNLIKDVTSLKLEKYLSEVVTAIAESWTRLKTSADIWAATEVCSLLHQRFAPNVFADPLLGTILKGFAHVPDGKDMTPEGREKEETQRLTRQRSTLRLLTELYIVGLARDAPDGKEGLIVRILKQLLINDKDAMSNISLAVTFVRYYGDQFLGKIIKGRRGSGMVSATTEQPPATTNAAAGHESDPVSGNETSRSSTVWCLVYAAYAAEDLNVQEQVESLVPQDIRTKVKIILVEYFETAARQLVRAHKHIRKEERRNHEFYIARGEIYEDRQDRYEKGLKAYEKLFSNVQTLAEYLEQEMPPLPEDESVTRLAGGIGILEGGKTVQEKDSTSGPWEDEDAKAFYENLVDLKHFVPAVFLGVKKPDAEQGEKDQAEAGPEVADEEQLNEKLDVIDIEDVDEDAQEDGDDAAQEEEPTGGDEAEEIQEPSFEMDDDADEDDKSKVLPPSEKVALDSLLTRLSNAMNRDSIDQIATDFAYLNSKAARGKLLRTLIAVPRTRLDLLPYYGRLVATLNPYMPDIGTKLVDSLEQSFHYHQKRKNQVFIEEKIKRRCSPTISKNIRFIGELAKFKLAPNHVVFHCLKVLLEDFKFHNIELACNLLETSGRFLFKMPETHTRTSNYLDILNKKKAMKYIDSRQALMIENAYYACNPPERSAMSQKHREPVELYMRKLIYFDLTRKNVDKILKQFRKFNWDDPTTRQCITKLFHKIWKVKFSHLHLMAALASELSRYYPEFGVGVVDNTLEEIRVGMEANLFKWNQRRIATVKFLGELYNYRMVDSGVVFETLYLLVRFGHENGVPMPGVSSPIDATHDFFRVRLCCTLLDTCGQCFDRGSTAKKLDQFLVFLQMYILTKIRPPMDVDFLISETFELLRPNMKHLESYEEAVQEVNRIAMEQREAAGAPGAANGIAEEDSDDDEDEDEDEEGGGGPRRGGSPVGDENDEDAASEHSSRVVDMESDEVVVHLPPQEEEEDDGYDDDFEKEFSKVMQESLESRKHERKPAVFDVAIPRRVKEQVSSAAGGGEESDAAEGEGEVTFMLLTKKGSKQQAKVMAVPADSDFVRSTRSKLEAEQEEKLQLKRLVLNYEERARADAEEAMTQQGSPIELCPDTNQTQRVPQQGRVLWSNAASRGRGYFGGRGYRGGGYQGGGGGYRGGGGYYSRGGGQGSSGGAAG
ncbi:hypothetical protein HK097_010505 [Rhizophlyctis rosea]|uniref:MIF4G domain-containing protein n=1 Tax=Rhizophlyctis rosea TaxID=64517 RepID=A0AAD5X3Q0_9FUNG|nr:hypothetical protein HK097_010505 [Rhizophlyctis rosea]